MRILLQVFCILCCLAASAQPGKHPRQLKGSFYFYCDYFSYVHFGMQSDGKYIFCGSTGRDDDADIFISRYLEDGSPDEGFGSKGIIHIDLAGYKDVPVFLKVMADDKIFIGAVADNAYSYRTLKGNMVLIRLNADGTADDTYGEHGKVTEKPDRRYKGLMSAATTVDGTSYLLRRYDYRNQFDFGISSYSVAGRVNESFGNNGHINGSVRKFDDNGMDVCLQADGKLLVTGQSHTGPSDVAPGARHNPVDVYIARYNSDGSLDSDFGNNGKIVTDMGSNRHTPRRVCVSGEGRILIAGSISQQRKQSDVFVYSFNANGHPDTLFAGRGILRLRYSSNDEGNDIVAAGDGKFYVAGSITRGNEPYVFLSRFNADGSADTSFNKKGRVIFEVISEQPSIMVQPDGKILVGALATIDRRNYYVLSRFLPNGKVDGAFGRKDE